MTDSLAQKVTHLTLASAWNLPSHVLKGTRGDRVTGEEDSDHQLPFLLGPFALGRQKSGLGRLFLVLLSQVSHEKIERRHACAVVHCGEERCLFPIRYGGA